MTECLERVGKDTFLHLMQDLMVKNKEGPLSFLQNLSQEKFLRLGLPDRSKENYQYVPLNKLYEGAFEGRENSIEVQLETSRLPESANSSFVFVDGCFSKELSSLDAMPKQVVIMPLSAALTGSYSSYLKHRMQMLTQEEGDSLALLNGAVASDGLFIYVPPKVKIEAPIQFLFLQTGKQAFCVSRIHLFMGAQAEAHFVSSIEGDCRFYNGFLDVALEEKAICSYACHTGLDSTGGNFSFFRATLKKGSFLKSDLVTFGGDLLRHDYKVSLLGEMAEVELRGLAPLTGAKQAHVHVHVEHSAPSCRSHQLFKNVLLAKSRSSFTGKIYVKRVAQKTQAYQLNKNLVLSDLAMAFSKPNLEIFADDVKASHGSTIAQLEEEHLLYLRTRGISLEEAQALLIHGFCEEILEKISIASLRSRLFSLSLACLK